VPGSSAVALLGERAERSCMDVSTRMGLQMWRALIEVTDDKSKAKHAHDVRKVCKTGFRHSAETM